ncbi:MAG TPA: transcriptional regulator, partial [Balneola sp.]|nr:transcriptional regulator [Balneola sp.]
MTSVFNPSMLILARESRGLTQSKLSELIGLSQGKLSKVEKGLQTLP